MDSGVNTFFELVRAGLWETEVRLKYYEGIDWVQVYKIAEEQSVVGLVAAGLEHVSDIKVPQEVALTFVGSALQLEKRNLAMNDFIAKLIEKLRKDNISALLVKGQGIAQCYERPLWRICGDIDLLFDEAGYRKAKKVLIKKAKSVEDEDTERKHIGMNIDQWVVELHGTMHSWCLDRMNRVVDIVQKEMFVNHSARVWRNGKSDILLPSENNDVVFVFAHIIQHYFGTGVGLRQICDWCRLLWTYKDSLNHRLLESRIRKAGVMSEWKAFGAFAVDFLGMPVDAMPSYSSSNIWKRKARRIMKYIMKVGNMGHNRDMSYINERPYVIRKVISLYRSTVDGFRQFQVFPLDSVKVWSKKMLIGFSKTAKGC